METIFVSLPTLLSDIGLTDVVLATIVMSPFIIAFVIQSSSVRFLETLNLPALPGLGEYENKEYQAPAKDFVLYIILVFGVFWFELGALSIFTSLVKEVRLLGF